jgi:hypothetical protein
MNIQPEKFIANTIKCHLKKLENFKPCAATLRVTECRKKSNMVFVILSRKRLLAVPAIHIEVNLSSFDLSTKSAALDLYHNLGGQLFSILSPVIC